MLTSNNEVLVFVLRVDRGRGVWKRWSYSLEETES